MQYYRLPAVLCRLIQGAVLGSACALVLAGCGGSSAVVSAPDAGQAKPTPALTDGGVQSMPVRMQPQDAVALPAKGLSWAGTAGLAAQLPRLNRSISSVDPLLFGASFFEAGLPVSRVETLVAPDVRFSPKWDAADPRLSDAAYATFRFNLTGLVELPEDTISLGWTEPPASLDDAFVGLANWGKEGWDWYQLDDDGIITLPGLERYVSNSHEVLAMVLVLGQAECVLSVISIGEPEVRGLGGLGEIPGAPTEPRLYIEYLPTALDLSDGCAPVRDQGLTAAAAAFALGDGAYNYELNRIYGELGWDFADVFNRASPRQMYVETGYAQGLDCSRGRNIWQSLEWLRDNGAATEANAPWGYPTTPGWCQRNWSAEARLDATVLQPETLTSFDPSGEDGVANLKAMLALQQRPVALQLGVDWWFADYQPGTAWHCNSPVVGYHVVCVTGYSDSRGGGAFKARNSWSDAWGEDGYVWISYDVFTNPAPGQRLWCFALADDYQANAAQRYCGAQAELPPPVNVRASDLGFVDKVAVEWDAVDGATGYKVYRDTQDHEVADVTATSWDDESITDLLAHTYWVRAYDGAQESALSTLDTGWRGDAPVIVSVSPATGKPGQEREFGAVVTSELPVNYNWDFGGGASPNTSRQRYPEVVLGGEGTYEASLTVTNAVGSDEFTFYLLVYEHTYTVSGVVETTEGAGIPCVELSFNGHLQPVLTDANGHWVRDGVPDGSYIVTPSLGDVSFTPASFAFTIAGADLELDPFKSVATPIWITDLITDKLTHCTDGSDGVNSTLAATASSTPTSVDWACSAGAISGEGLQVEWAPTGGPSPQVATVTCTVRNGVYSDSRELKLYLTQYPISRYGDANGECYALDGPSILHLDAPYISTGGLLAGGQHVVVVAQWGLWDYFGKAQMAYLQDYMDWWGADGLYVTGINRWDTTAEIQSWLTTNGYYDIDTWLVNTTLNSEWFYWNGFDDLGYSYGSCPMNVIHDRDGHVRWACGGSMTRAQDRRMILETMLSELVGQPKP